jgi:uncharacterized coiled-coil DUF342 family protein
MPTPQAVKAVRHEISKVRQEIERLKTMLAQNALPPDEEDALYAELERLELRLSTLLGRRAMPAPATRERGRARL